MTDEEIIDRIATEVVGRIGDRPVSAAFRRRLVSLYVCQATGILPPPGRIADLHLGPALGIPRKALPRIRATALTKCLRTCLSRYPELTANPNPPTP